jgi:small-conductance mechanosensitive channel
MDLTALAVFSGALGFGFGLQKIVSNYLSGIIILVDKSIKPGAAVQAPVRLVRGLTPLPMPAGQPPSY